MRRRRRTLALAAASALAVLLAGPAPGAPVTAGRDGAATPRAYLIYLIGTAEPLVVERYVEEDDQIRFEKYGGWVGIPRYEVLRIVPDVPAPPGAGGPGPAEDPGTPLYVTTRGGASLRATAVGEEGPHVRVHTAGGSVTLPRADVIGVLRVPPPPASPEAWLSLVGANGLDVPVDREARAALHEVDGSAAGPALPPLAHSARPHLLHLAGGRVLEIDGFWIEDGQLRFRRLGGVVGLALSEIARLVPQEPAPADGRTAALFLRRLATDRLEVRVGGAVQRIRLIGVEPIAGSRSPRDPGARLAQGLLLQLEFDRQRYDPAGDWLAYVYLPSGRMLNAELIRTGLARPRPDPHNLRHADLLHEAWLAAGQAAEPGRHVPPRRW